MTIIDQFSNGPFDYQEAMRQLSDYRAPRDRLGLLLEQGQVIRVKKGLYVPGDRSVDPLVLSGLVYGPSYVSLETALSIHGLIPEYVAEITSVTSKRGKLFTTPIGRFRYQPVNERVLSCGFQIAEAAGGNYLLAVPEKALCDRVARVQGLSAQRDIEPLLTEDLRIDMDALASFHLPLVAEIAARYSRKNVSAFHRWLEKWNHRKVCANEPSP